jgi:hypothetical protein
MTIRPLPLLCLLAIAGAVAAADDLPCPRFAAAPTIDGDLADWAGRPTLAMSDASMVEDLKVEQAGLGWDDTHLFFSLRMLDHHLLNEGSGRQIANGDCAELRLTLPCGDSIRLCIAPTSADGKPALYLGRSTPNGPASDLAMGSDPKVEVKGVRWAVRSDADGWTVEAGLPLALIGIAPRPGIALPCVAIGWDHDTSGDWAEWHCRSESANQKKPESWPKLVLAK